MHKQTWMFIYSLQTSHELFTHITTPMAMDAINKNCSRSWCSSLAALGMWGKQWNIDEIFHLSSGVQNVQAGHKYLFSDVTHTWADAVLECQMYGGWLVGTQITSVGTSLNSLSVRKLLDLSHLDFACFCLHLLTGPCFWALLLGLTGPYWELYCICLTD